MRKARLLKEVGKCKVVVVTVSVTGPPQYKNRHQKPPKIGKKKELIW
jgi:hypothetical protein